MRERLVMLLSGLLLVLAGTAPGQSLTQVCAQFDQAEDRIFELKGHGRYHEALDALFGRLMDLVRIHSASPEEIQAEVEARGECYIELVHILAVSTSRFDEALEVLDRIPEEAPFLKARARYSAMMLNLHRGRTEEARALKKELGYIDGWYVIGPFDNERGGGFGTACGPEGALDRSAEYKGKERPVKWRKLSIESRDGFINLNALFNPSDQCLAYALAFLESDEERDAALCTGSDEALKVFVNGRPVYSLDARRLHHFDQDVIGIHLRRGVNTLLLKICDQTGGFGFAARLATPSGRPLPGVRAVEWPDPFRPEEASSPAPGIEVSTGALGYFEQRALQGDIRARLYLGILHNVREYKGEKAGKATQYLNAFLKAHPDHVYGLYLKALSESRRSDIAAERDENRWRAGLERTLELDPDWVESRIRLGGYYVSTLRIPNAALEHAKTALETNAGFPPASYLLAEAYEAKKLPVLGRQVILDLAHNPAHLGYPRLRLMLGDIALEDRRVKDAEEHWEAALEIDRLNGEARGRLIDRALQRGDMEKARSLLEEQGALDPFDAGPLMRLALLSMGDGRGEGALPCLERVLEINPEDDQALKRMGDAYRHMDQEAEALAAYGKALEINPKSKNLRRYVEFISELERPFEDRFKVDVMPMLAAHPPGENPENDSHEYLLLQNVYKVNMDGTSSHYHHRIVRILNLEGAKLFDYFSTYYTPGEQKCRIQTARVIHPDGTVEEAKIDNQPPLEGRGSGERAPAYVDLPPIRAGDVVDLAFRTDDLRQSFFGDYFGLRQFFQAPDLKAVKDARLTLILPAGRGFKINQKYMELAPEVERDEESGTVIRTWTLPDLPKIDQERYMPDRAEYTPYVEATSYESWDAFGRWWWNLVEEQCDINDEMKAKVVELTQGLQNEREKARAIYNFVVSEIRYNDTWEFGVHGFKPYRATAIYTNRFGDCKDKAILLKSLLNEAGIEAYPVLIRLDLPRSKEDLTLPLVSHFNHVIAHVPEADGGKGFFLDGTAQFHPMEALPDADQGATVFVVQDGPGKILTIPYMETASRIDQYTVAVQPDGKGAIQGRNESFGSFEADLRRQFLNPGKRKSNLEEMFGRVLGDVSIQDFRFTDMENLNEPVRYEVTLEVKDFLLKSGDRVQLRPVFFKSVFFSLGSEDERHFDLLLGAPFTIRTRIQYRLPPGFSIPEPPEDTVLDNEFVSFSLTFERDGEDGITVRRILSVKEPRIPVKHYPAFRDFCREAERAEERLIQIKKNG